MPGRRLRLSGSAIELAQLRERIDGALEERAVALYRHAAERLKATGMPADDALALLQSALPCYTVTAFEVSDWPVPAPPQCQPILDSLPGALADLATGCALAQARSSPPFKVSEPLDLAGHLDLTSRLSELRVQVRTCGVQDGDGPSLLIELAPGTPPKRAAEELSGRGRTPKYRP